MTILAGILSRREGRGVPDSARADLRRAITRHPSDEVEEFGDGASCLLKVDVGAYGEPASHRDAAGRVSLLAGEALLSSGEADAPWRTRTEDLARLHEAWAGGRWDELRAADGTFCAAHYDPAARRLSLVADKLSLRPLYYWVGEEFAVFASALRVLEALPLVPKEMDLRAVTEMASIGLPLGTRTPYAGVSLLRAGEVLHVDGRGVSARRYWRWDEVAPSGRPEAELTRAAYESFTRAVARRLRGDARAVAFLSGGLDSRAVAAALFERGVRLHTFNFAPAGTQDQIFGAMFAREVGAAHEEAPMGPGDPHWSQMMADAYGASTRRRGPAPAARERIIWSGDGGSVGLGHVYVYEPVVALLREGRTPEAVEEFLAIHRAAVPRRILSPSVSGALDDVLRAGVREELDDLHCEDRGRALYLFLMHNDQRRHLARHFEDIDLHRLEFHLPFYDGDFLASVVRVPVELCLRHKFYMKWLDHFPAVVKSVPWQSYAGHEPCPLPAPPDLATQWEPGPRAAERKRRLLGQAAEMLRAPDFPDELLKRNYLSLATWVYRAGLRDYGYLIQAAQTYHKYSAICGGRHVLPPRPAPAAAG
ncbi:MAG TPA: asparagine synthase-related protein [Pyrinomonadaceae bacterium]|nr:asparagine synthase-related protein [Pyrinomonadaceae bacterium]